MAISWDSFDKIWASTSPLTPYSFSDPNYAQGWNFVGSTPPARQMWDSIQKQNDEKFKYLRDNFGTPNIVTQASQMTDTDKVYVYLGSEAGWNSGHWYYYDEGTSSWADGGVYNSVAFVTDTTLSIAGQPADAKATGDALALKSDLAGCTFTGNVGINADLSVTGDATIGTDLSVTGVSTLTGNVSAGADVTVVGDVSSANLTTSADATIGGDLSVTGTSTLAGNITTSGDISADNISATTNGTIGGNLSVTGTSTLTGNINAGADITAVGDVSADNLTTTTNATVGGSLSVAGTSTLTGNVTTNGNISAVGDISSANLTTTNATIGGNATVTGDVSCANLTTSADASVGVDLTVTGDSTLADTTVNNLVVNNDLSVAGDSSLTNLSVSGTTALAGTSTAPTPSADDNSTNIATTEYVQTEIKPIEVNADIVNKRVTNIEKLLQGNLYDYQTDTDSKYTKTVPAGAMPYASLDSIGGKTLVWNQLVNTLGSLYDAGVSHSVADDVYTITSNKDAVSQKYLRFVEASKTIQNHVYLGIADILVDNSDYYVYVQFVTAGGGSALSDETSYRATDTTKYVRSYTLGRLTNVTTGFVVRFANAMPQDVGGKAKNVQLYDLTLMFGAGNEPSTLAEFESQFSAQYYSYNAGTLLSAGVTEVVSKGRNLINATDFINVTSQSSVGSFTLKAGTYTLSATVTNNQGSIVGYVRLRVGSPIVSPAININILGADSNVRKSASFTLAEDNIVYIEVAGASSGYNVSVTQFQIQVGSTATDYSPYHAPIQYPIPAEIRALEGYGWSAGSVFNYVDFERKVFVKCVDRVDMGTMVWSNAGQWFYSHSLASTIKPCASTVTVGNLLTSPYPTVSYSTLTGGADKTISYGRSTHPMDYVMARDSAYTTDVAFTTAMNGVYLYYELATPIETDISAYLTDDNLISVEAGGTLTFPNQHGDDYRIDVPSSETYMVDLQEAI